jgi:hypothetical protein
VARAICGASESLNRASTLWALNDLQSSIQSGSISVILPHPKSVQFGAYAQALLWGHLLHRRALDVLCLGMTDEEADASIHCWLVARFESSRVARLPTKSSCSIVVALDERGEFCQKVSVARACLASKERRCR